MNQRSTDWLVDHFVLDQRSRFRFFKCVLVVPEPIRSFELPIDEAVRRFPSRDFGPPFNRDLVDADLVVQQQSCLHLHWHRRQDFEVQNRWSNSLKLLCVGEKFENSLQRLFDQHFSSKPVSTIFVVSKFDHQLVPYGSF